LLNLLVISLLGGIHLNWYLQSIFEHGPSIRQDDNDSIGWHLLLVKLEVIGDRLLLNQGGQCFDIVDSVVLELPLLHDSLITNNDGSIQELKNTPFKLVSVIILFGSHFCVF
jgi:hypothetical protein